MRKLISFSGLNIVITGRLKKMTRSEANKLIAVAGGYPRKKVSSRTDALIISDDFKTPFFSTEKLEKFLELKSKGFEIEVISEEQFYNIVEGRH